MRVRACVQVRDELACLYEYKVISLIVCCRYTSIYYVNIILSYNILSGRFKRKSTAKPSSR